LVMLVWLLITAVMTFVYHLETRIQIQDAALIVAPPFFVLLFLLTSVWYVCKSTPLTIASGYALVMRHGASLIFIILVWLLLISLYSELLIKVVSGVDWTGLLQQSIPFYVLSGLFFYFFEALLNYFIIVMEKARETEEQALQDRITAVQAELKSLKSTIHPHFLFNSFAALDTLIRTDPQKARQVCLQLSDFLRYSIRYGEKDFVTVADELEHIKNYLGVEKVRFGDRLQLNIEAEPKSMDQKILPFILLPLAENAIKHGISQMANACRLSFRIYFRNSFLRIDVKNPYDPSSRSRQISGTGLENLKRRLKTYYGKEVYIKLVKKDGMATAIVDLPVEAIQG